MTNKSLGSYGESLAEGYLRALGYLILEKNFRHKLGEIDLIAQDRKTVCFIEVKTRQSTDQGQPFEAITPWKIRKLTQLATFYLKYRFKTVEILSRFDVISIVQENKDAEPRIDHIKNAFDVMY